MTGTRRPAILVVEVEGAGALDLEPQLRALGYEVPATTGSGEEAVSLARKHRPDLILMDVHLKGGLDGISAAENIRAELEIPVVFLTAYSDAATVDRALATGPYSFLLKPFEARELQIAVEIALYRHASERRLRESERWLAATLWCVADGIVAVDSNDRIVLMNRCAAELTGWDRSAAKGRIAGEVLRLSPPDRESGVQGGITERGTFKRRAVLLNRIGKEIEVEVTETPILAEDGSHLGRVYALRDLTETRRAARELESRSAEVEEARERAVSAEARTDEFLSVVGHELRTPLNGITGFASALADGVFGQLAASQDHPIQAILAGANQLERLISNLVDFGRLRAGTLVLAPAEMDVVSLVGREVEALGQRARVKGIALEFEATAATPARSRVDPGHFGQLLFNLLDGAVRSTDRGGRVTVSTSGEDDYLIVLVSATVAGGSDEVQDEDFKPLTQPEMSLIHSYGGSGIGIALSKAVAEAHGGTIDAQVAPGIGAAYRVRLPIAGPLPGGS